MLVTGHGEGRWTVVGWGGCEVGWVGWWLGGVMVRSGGYEIGWGGDGEMRWGENRVGWWWW